MTQLLFNPLANSVIRPSGVGRVFFVDQVNGDNANNGIAPDTPFETITEALTHCVALRHDYIYVLLTEDGSEPVYPVDINIHWVHVIGISGDGPLFYGNINGGGNACLSLSCNGVELAGFGFHTTGAADVAIDCTAVPYSGWVHHCRFAGSALAQGLSEGISGTFNWALIEDNFFSSPNGVGITAHGIIGGLVGCIIRRNYFTAPAAAGGECIHLTPVEIGQIVDNYFYSPISDAGVVGWAIFLEGAGNEGGIITNNHAAQTGDNTGLNPYRDTSTPGVIATLSHGWGMNYSGQAVIAPATL